MAEHAGQRPPFRVIGQKHDTIVNAQGQFEHVMRVDYETPSGVQASHTHPMATYNAQNVAAAIAPVAQEIERVHALGNAQ